MINKTANIFLQETRTAVRFEIILKLRNPAARQFAPMLAP
jgi:hypothetical protein